ncbi:MAG: hypothetical protein NDI69_14655 [Bacteriovoracaceae bacterium]|nr:hypothetical protein [Bacteriovoracaceae bacterium]
MKLFFLVLFSLSLMSCASTRSPSSVNSDADNIEEGINAEYYGSPSLN